MSIYMQLKYKTKFRDKEILKEALNKAQVRFIEQYDELICNITFYELHFRKNTDNIYEIQTTGYDDWKSDIKEFRNKIEKHYEQIMREKEKERLQKQICEDIKAQVIKNSSMNLEQEEVLEDNSILLTISI